MPVFAVGLQKKGDQSIFQVHVTADSAAEALRLLRQKYPAPEYSLAFIIPSRDKDIDHKAGPKK
ncbi:hypothetical protein ACFFWD_37660 [Bradyrhizobium erythrophlei]|uniref:hypothetical protein n=1 Tax=Bradyrhizobium erythrophlei TaxID=1437360 RepID=UPI0035E8146C